MTKKRFYHIDIEPIGRRGQCLAEQSLLDCARQLGVRIISICGGDGLCLGCKVQMLSGSVSEPTSIERAALSPQELEHGYRLACQAFPATDCKLRVPPESMTTPQRMQVEGVEVTVAPDPPVSTYHIQLPPPSLSDLQADDERLLETLEQQHQVHCSTIDIDVLRNLSPQLRSWNWQARASVRSDELVALSSWPGPQLGLAIDLGTTKIAGYLVDLHNGQTVAAKGSMNPQLNYGEDIITRISRVMKSATEAARMQELVIKELNKLAVELCAEVDARPEEIIEVVIVGNTAMHHLLLRLPVKQLGLSPYVPTVRDALNLKARDVGLYVAPGAYIHTLPNVAGFVGADHIAMLLATEAWRIEGLAVAIDIGTNTEVCLISDGEMSSVSCASGPAFEGAHIKCGMRAASGAIERLRLVNDRVEYQTIDGTPPVGLCGSGILDAMAQLYLAGVVDKSGKMNRTHPRVRTAKKQSEFVLIDEEERDGGEAITITQHDIRELQLAKGAIYTGIQVLLEAKKHSEEELQQVIIAGAFGSYIDVSSAVTIGMLPPLPLEHFRQVGNAAGMGAKLALISLNYRTEAQNFAHQIHYIELATAPKFLQTFTQATCIGHCTQ